MSIKEKLEKDVKEAMKARDTPRLNCLRMLKSKLLEREVALRAKEGKDYSISDDEALEAIGAYAKQRRDSIESYRKAGRNEAAAEEQAELEIVMGYLPEQLSEDEIREHVRAAIAESGAQSVKEMGAVMKSAMARTKGAADGKLVQRIARELLS